MSGLSRKATKNSNGTPRSPEHSGSPLKNEQDHSRDALAHAAKCRSVTNDDFTTLGTLISAKWEAQGETPESLAARTRMDPRTIRGIAKSEALFNTAHEFVVRAWGQTLLLWTPDLRHYRDLDIASASGLTEPTTEMLRQFVTTPVGRSPFNPQLTSLDRFLAAVHGWVEIR